MKRAAGLILLLAATAASGRDPHACWDDRCRSCHGDAGPFASSTLQRHAGLSADEQPKVVDTLARVRREVGG